MSTTVASPERPSWWDLGAWLAVCTFLLFQLVEVFSNRALAGWDLVPQYTLYVKFLDLLRLGQLSTYDLSMFGGFAEFTLYPPLGYFILGLPHLLGFGAISQQFSFNIVIGALPFLYLATLYWCACQFFSRQVARWSLLVGAFYLASPPDFGMTGMGLFSLFWGGLIFSFMALPLLCVLLGLLERLRTAPQIRWLDFSLLLVCFSTVALLHLLSALFAAWITAGFLIALPSWRRRVALLMILVLACALVSWWYGPFLQHLPFSSSSTEGLTDHFGNPLLAYVPGVSLGRFLELWRSRDEVLSIIPALPGIVSLPLPSTVPAWLAYAPWSGFVICAGLIYGVLSLVRARSFFLLVGTLVTLLLLPSDFFADGTETGIHFYRFVQPLSVLVTLITALGLACLSQLLRRSNAVRARLAWVACVCVIGWAFFTNNFLLFSVNESSILQQPRFHQYIYQHRLFLDRYPEYDNSKRVLDYIDSLKPSGRVAVESSVSDVSRLGTPHLFNSLLPLLYDIPVVGGLLVESTPVSPLLTPTLSAHSRHLLWGSRDLAYKKTFIEQPLVSMIERLQSYSVEYLLASSTSYDQKLRALDTSLLQPLKVYGPYSLFKLSSFAPYVYRVDNRPALFLGTIDEFREFSEIWFSAVDLISRPVLFRADRRDLNSAPTASEKSRFGAIIVRSKQRGAITLAQADGIADAWGAPVIVFGSRTGFTPRTRWIEHAALAEQTSQLAFHLNDVLGALVKPPLVAIPASISATRMHWDAVGLTGTTFSFAPRWQPDNSLPQRLTKSDLYMSASGQLFVFSNGDTTLHYR